MKSFQHHVPAGESIIKVLKVNWHTFKGSNSAPFNFVYLLNRDQLLKKEFALLRANSFFKSRPHFGWASSSREANRKS